MSGEAESLLASMLTGAPSDVAAIRRAARAAGIKMAEVRAAAMSLDVRIDGDQWTLPGHESDDAQDASYEAAGTDDTGGAPEGRETASGDREGALFAPGMELGDGERVAQCNRCARYTLTSTPMDSLPRCVGCQRVRKPRARAEAPWIDPDDSVEAWREGGGDLLDDWKAGRTGERDRPVMSRWSGTEGI